MIEYALTLDEMTSEDPTVGVMAYTRVTPAGIGRADGPLRKLTQRPVPLFAHLGPEPEWLEEYWKIAPWLSSLCPDLGWDQASWLSSGWFNDAIKVDLRVEIGPVCWGYILAWLHTVDAVGNEDTNDVCVEGYVNSTPLPPSSFRFDARCIRQDSGWTRTMWLDDKWEETELGLAWFTFSPSPQVE